MSVIDFSAKKAEREPHLSGAARCLVCEHAWIAVSPIGTTWLTCPECNATLGRYVNPVIEEGPHWHCVCGNELFFVTPQGSYCPVCGEDVIVEES